jgi:predicted aspartyl protease
MANKTLWECTAVIVLLSLNAAAKHNQDVQKIPFKLYRNHLVVASGRLGSIENRNLLIDTGASPTVVDEALAHELGLKPISRPGRGMTVVGGVAETYYAVLESLDLGPIHRESLLVTVANLSLMQASVGFRIDAIVGLDALVPSSFQIDYDSRKVIFGSVRTPASAVPMLLESRFAVIATQINGSPVKLAIDTGASEMVLFRNTLPETFASLTSTTNVQLSNLAGDLLVPEIQLANFKVGHEDLSGSTAVLTTVPNCCEFQGILGISSLRFKRVTFDFQHELLGLELVHESASPESLARACSEFSAASCQQAFMPGLLNPRR